MSDLLWAFCAAANHVPKCANWENHRYWLDQSKTLIDNLIEAIPTAIAIGKASQAAARSGQGTLIGETPVMPSEVYNYADPDLGPIRIDWDMVVGSGEDGPQWYWYTEDQHIGITPKTHLTLPDLGKADCRQATVTAYKPRSVQIYFDGEPDEWNDYR